MLIHQLSKITGVNIHTIRHYIKIGLISVKENVKSNTNNYKIFTETEIDKLQFIETCKSVGYSLEETKSIIDLLYNESLSSKKKQNLVNAEMDKIEQKIEALKILRKKLKKVD